MDPQQQNSGFIAKFKNQNYSSDFKKPCKQVKDITLTPTAQDHGLLLYNFPGNQLPLILLSYSQNKLLLPPFST